MGRAKITTTVKTELIQGRIQTIRGLHVILDRDLAEFYQVKSIRLREQVKRNKKRFPSDFMFQLTGEEVDSMVSQNAIPSKKHLGGYLPYVFTEQGVAAISAVLTSDRAIEINIAIMRAFVAMRRFMASNMGIFQRLETVERKQLGYKVETDQKFEQIFNAIESREITPKQGVFFNGQIFDAYKFVSDLVRLAGKTIVIVDNYVDDSVLDMLTKRKKNVLVTIFTKKISKQLALDLTKHNAQYSEVIIKEFKDAHDRFLIIDDKDVYHFGASLKDLGKKWFAFSKMNIKLAEMFARLKNI